MPRITLTEHALSGYLIGGRQNTPSWEDYVKFQNLPTSIILDNLYDSIEGFIPINYHMSLEDDVNGHGFTRALCVTSYNLTCKNMFTLGGNEDGNQIKTFHSVVSILEDECNSWYIDDPTSYDQIIEWCQHKIKSW